MAHPNLPERWWGSSRTRVAGTLLARPGGSSWKLATRGRRSGVNSNVTARRSCRAMRVSVFGLGYVGCVTAACLARAGHQVVGADINGEKVSMVNGGQSPLVEPGLGELLREVVAADRLRATTSTAEAVAQSDVALICVGTPSRSNGQLDILAIQRVAESIAQVLQATPRAYTVVLRSTVLPGTTEAVLI